MAHVHRENPPLAAHRGQGQAFGERAHVQGRRHHQQTQVLAQRLTDLLHQGQTQVRLQGTLVEFIEQHRRVAFQRRVVTQHAGQHALGDHLDARRRAHPGVQPGAVATVRPTGSPSWCAMNPATARAATRRLQHQKAAVAAPGRVQQHQRHAGGLTGAGRRLERGAALLGQTTAQLRQHGVHWQSKISGFSHSGILSEMAFRAGVSPAGGAGLCYCPSGTLEDRTSDREPTGTYSRRSRKGNNTDTAPAGELSRSLREVRLLSIRRTIKKERYRFLISVLAEPVAVVER